MLRIRLYWRDTTLGYVIDTMVTLIGYVAYTALHTLIKTYFIAAFKLSIVVISVPGVPRSRYIGTFSMDDESTGLTFSSNMGAAMMSVFITHS